MLDVLPVCIKRKKMWEVSCWIESMVQISSTKRVDNMVLSLLWCWRQFCSVPEPRRNVRTDRSVWNLGESRTNCMASKRLDLPLPLRPTTAFVPGENGWISGCCLNDRKLDIVICLMCIVERVWWWTCVDATVRFLGAPRQKFVTCAWQTVLSLVCFASHTLNLLEKHF